MANDVTLLSPAIQAVLRKNATLLLPLTAGKSSVNEEVKLLQSTPAPSLFPGARDPLASMSGLLLLLNQWEASHSISQEIGTAEGSYWHALAHRMEPDSFNAGYWFRRVGQHPVFSDLHRQASVILSQSSEHDWKLKARWDPFLFLEWCDEARQQPGSFPEQAALSIQRAEWQLLFDWCSRPPG